MFPQYIPTWNNPDDRIMRKWETILKVEFFSHGQIYIYGGDRPDLMRGPNPQGVILDEFSYMKPEIWDSVVQPIMRSNPDAWCWFLFTPCGKNHAERIFNYGKQNSKEWKSWEMNIHQSKIFTNDQIEEAKKTSLEQAWRSEYLCEFIEGAGSVFRGVRDDMTSKPEQPKQGHLYVMGADIAKVTDFTVATIYDRANNNQVYQSRWQTLEWPFQKSKLIEIAKHYNNALTVIDATGIGDPIADDLIRAGLAVEPFKITPQTKKDLVEKLSIWIEQKKCTLIPIEESLIEFDNFAYDVSTSGKISYGAKEGFNDDIVISHALAVHALQPIVKIQVMPEMTPVQKAFIQAKEQYQRGLNYENESWNAE